MTTPQPQAPVDPANPLLTELPAQLVTALVDTPAGQRMALTIRTPSTTLTVFLSKLDAGTWAGNIKQTADSLSGSGLVVANGAAIQPKGQG